MVVGVDCRGNWWCAGAVDEEYRRQRGRRTGSSSRHEGGQTSMESRCCLHAHVVPGHPPDM